MDSVSHQQIRERAEAYDKTLYATDSRLRSLVIIKHHDGSVLQLRHAFLMQSGEWVICFTEHHGLFVYHEDDLESWSVFDRNFSLLEELP